MPTFLGKESFQRLQHWTAEESLHVHLASLARWTARLSMLKSDSASLHCRHWSRSCIYSVPQTAAGKGHCLSRHRKRESGIAAKTLHSIGWSVYHLCYFRCTRVVVRQSHTMIQPRMEHWTKRIQWFLQGNHLGSSQNTCSQRGAPCDFFGFHSRS